MKRKSKSLIASTLILVGIVGWTFRPYPTIDESKVHPSLRGLDGTTKCICTHFGDGGSVAIDVVRPDGSKVVLCMSNSLEHSFSERGQLYIGAMHFSRPGATRISGYDHTKFVIAKSLARDIPTDPAILVDIALLTKRTSDWIAMAFAVGPKETLDELRLFE